jgi:Transposase DDE domain group 1
MVPEANAPSTSQVPRAGQVRKHRKKAERLRSRGRRDRRAERMPEKRPIFHKVRRDVLGGKRGDGNERKRRVRRPDPRTIHIGKPDPHLTGVAGLVGFGVYLHELGVDGVLHKLFNHLKTGNRTVYVMGIQLRLLIDLFVLGEFRIFGLEALAADPLFVRLCGGVVPSLDTPYRDVRRFDAPEIDALEALMAAQGMALLGRRPRGSKVHVDIDTTVEPLFGDAIEGAEVGYNPQYHGRPSYHPVVIRIAEADTVVGAVLRPGNTTFGAAEVPAIVKAIDRTREAAGPDALLYARIDAAGDCTEVMSAVDQRGSFFLIKAKMDPHLMGAVSACTKWTTVDRDADGRPLRQVAEIDFARDEWRSTEWTNAEKRVRVIAVRSWDCDHGKPLYLWEGSEYTARAYLTNDIYSDADLLAQDYDGRAGIEPLIGEFKSHWGIAKVSSESFDANHVTLLLKLLAHNLLRRYVAEKAPHLRAWRVPWLRRALILVPGRLVMTAGRKLVLHMAPRSEFTPRE